MSIIIVTKLVYTMYVHAHVHVYASVYHSTQCTCISATCSAVDIEAVIPSIPNCASLVVRFPEGSHVNDSSQSPVELPVVLEFTSSQPVTLTGHLIFQDTNSGKK